MWAMPQREDSPDITDLHQLCIATTSALTSAAKSPTVTNSTAVATDNIPHTSTTLKGRGSHLNAFKNNKPRNIVLAGLEKNFLKLVVLQTIFLLNIYVTRRIFFIFGRNRTLPMWDDDNCACTQLVCAVGSSELKTHTSIVHTVELSSHRGTVVFLPQIEKLVL